MSDLSSPAHPVLSDRLQQAQRRLTQIRLRTDSCTLAWHLLAALLAAGVVDILWPLPAAARGLFLVGLAGYAARSGRKAWRQESVRSAHAAYVARAIETVRPELDNALIHAVQFGEAISSTPPDTPSAILMRLELERAERETASLPLEQAIPREPLRRERTPLLAILAFTLVSALLFPRVYRFELPRFLAFWGDFPPFTLTDFDVDPSSPHIRAGEGVDLTVRVSGLMPHHLELITGRSGEKPQTLPLAALDNGLFTGQLEGLRQDTWFYVTGDTGRSARYLVHVDNAPRIVRLRATLQPPPYTHRPPEIVEVPPEGELHGLAGTRIALDVEADQPLAESRLILWRAGMSEQSLSLQPLPGTPKHAAGRFVLARSGAYRIDLTGARERGGLRKQDAAHGKVVLQQDEVPVVTITAPGQNLYARADMTVPLVVEASDDVGLQRLEMHRIYNRGKDVAQIVPVPDGLREMTHADRIDLPAMQAKPGDVIEYYATAYDNDPQGIHNADSERYWIHVVSSEDYRRLLAKQRGPQQLLDQYRSVTEALNGLAEAQTQLAADLARTADQERRAATPGERARTQAQTGALRKRQQEIAQATRDLQNQARELMQQPDQIDAEKGLKRKIAQIAQAAGRAEQSMRAAVQSARAGQMQPPAQAAAGALQQAAQSAGQSVERTVDGLGHLSALYQDLDRLQQIAREQAQTAQQARQTADALHGRVPDPFQSARLKSLAGKQGQLQTDLTRLAQDLKTHAQEAQTAGPEAARQAAALGDRLNALGVERSMESARQALEQQNAGQGAEHAEAARKALESLMPQAAQCRGQTGGQCNTLCQAQLGQGAGNSLSQLSRLGRSGQGNGEGQGAAQGSGAYSAPAPGSRPGDQNGQSSANGQQAAVLGLTQQSGGGMKPRKSKPTAAHGERSGEPGTLDIETPVAPQDALPKATDAAASRYPPEYRRLVQDYFKAVAGGK